MVHWAVRLEGFDPRAAEGLKRRGKAFPARCEHKFLDIEDAEDITRIPVQFSPAYKPQPMGSLISKDKLVCVVKVLKPELGKFLEQGRCQLRLDNSLHIITGRVLI